MRALHRWSLNIRAWDPSPAEWEFVLQLLSPAEREKVMKFRFEHSRRREFCHFADVPSASLLKQLRKGEGGAAE